MPSLTISLNPKGDLHKRILSAIRERHRLSSQRMVQTHERWKSAEDKFLAYLPETELDAERRTKRENQGRPQYTTLVLPYSYAMLMAAHSYWTTVFLGRHPVFQFAGRHGESEMQVQAIEALMDYQVQVGGQLVPLYIWLLDVGKYGVGVMGEYWEEEVIQVSQIEEQEEKFLGFLSTGETKKVKTTRRSPGYQGNKLFNIRPYNFFPDPRVPLHDFQKGEFCGYYTEIGWNEVLRRAALGQYTNTEELRSRPRTGENFKHAGSSQMELPNIEDALASARESEGRATRGSANFFGLREYYIELVPNEWGLGKSKFPEKWVFTTDATITLVIEARPHGALHNKFPFAVIEFEPEGYSLTNRSMMDVLDPMQRTMDWLVNSHFYNVRKVLNDTFLVDPSRVVMKDIEDQTRPGGAIRLKPSAYGTDVRTAIHQMQVQDVTRSHLDDIQMMMQFGQRVTGISDQVMGMLNTTGRKTAQEVRTSTTFGVNRLKTISEYFGAVGFQPLSQRMLQNTQQYYSAEKQFRIVGDYARLAGTEFAQVTPETIQGFFDFVPVDGTLPVDRFAQANLWRELLAQMSKVPQVAEQYDFGKIFAWVAQLSGIKNIHQFKVQVVPDAQASAQSQQGNLVPLEGGQQDPGRVPESGQVGGMGTTG